MNFTNNNYLLTFLFLLTISGLWKPKYYFFVIYIINFFAICHQLSAAFQGVRIQYHIPPSSQDLVKAHD